MCVLMIVAGTAGLALGARLSEANNISVLVLDGGLSPETIGNYKVPGAAYNVLSEHLSQPIVTLLMLTVIRHCYRLSLFMSARS